MGSKVMLTILRALIVVMALGVVGLGPWGKSESREQKGREDTT